MSRKDLVAVGAKLHMGRLQDCCETAIMYRDPRHTLFIKEFGDDKKVKSLEYLKQSLTKAKSMKISQIYIKGLNQPGYFIKIEEKTKSKEEHQRDLIENYLPETFRQCGLTRDKIKPLSQEQQDIVETWLYRRSWKHPF